MVWVFAVAGALIVGVLLVVLQGKHTKAKAVRLPEALGPRLQNGSGDVSVLHVGESTVAGVGVEHLDDGLTAHLIRDLEQRSGRSLRWQVFGENGATVADLMTRRATIENPDVLVLTFGVNDTTQFTGKRRWVENLVQCVAQFSDVNTRVFITAVPPMQRFPLLPAPLSWLLGLKSAQLDRALAIACDQFGWHYVENKFELVPEYMSHDGYHPNVSGYQLWGAWIAENVSADWVLKGAKK